MHRYHIFLTERQFENLKQLSEFTGIAVSELVRRFIDHSAQSKVLDEIIPFLSGQIKIGK